MPFRTPLYGAHVSSGATFVEFGGWEMPLRYTSIVGEHLAVRRSAGLFDVSHMGKILVSGPSAQQFLHRLSANDIPKKPPRARYTHFLDERGRILDDVIVTCLAPDQFLVVCNAAPRQRVLAWLQEHADDVEVRDLTFDYLCLALQGPKAAHILGTLTTVDVGSMKGFSAAYCDLRLRDVPGEGRTGPPPEAKGWGPPVDSQETGLSRAFAPPVGRPPPGGCVVTRTGYTGEDGFELFPYGDRGEAVWTALLDAGRAAGLRPAGLGARDTLRLEKGFLLSGAEFDGRQTPLEASVEWLVKWGHPFVGREALRRQKERGDHDRLVGLLVREPGVPRRGCAVARGDRRVGVVTSGTTSPSLKVGIALAYVRPEVAPEGTDVAIVVRGRPLRAVVKKPPFL